jgi:hypothetical protein
MLLVGRGARAVCQPEKRKVDSSILSLTTSAGYIHRALTSGNTGLGRESVIRSRSRCCPFGTVFRRPMLHVGCT